MPLHSSWCTEQFNLYISIHDSSSLKRYFMNFEGFQIFHFLQNLQELVWEERISSSLNRWISSSMASISMVDTPFDSLYLSRWGRIIRLESPETKFFRIAEFPKLTNYAWVLSIPNPTKRHCHRFYIFFSYYHESIILTGRNYAWYDNSWLKSELSDTLFGHYQNYAP